VRAAGFPESASSGALARLSTLDKAALRAIVAQHRRSGPECDCRGNCPGGVGHRPSVCVACRRPHPCIDCSEAWTALAVANETMGTPAGPPTGTEPWNRPDY
jgi:hypothetical protein